MLTSAGLADLHTHTARCGHARGMERDYVEQALALGLKAIAVTDHIPFYWLPREQHDPTLAMAPEELPRYVESVLRLKAEFADRIEVLLGIEADYVEGHEETLAKILASYPFDVVLGSVHWLDGFWVDAPASSSVFQQGPEVVQSIWERYWRKMEKAVTSGLFDVLAHLDLPKKFGYRPEEPLMELEERVWAAICKAGVAVELSSAGRRKPAGEDYPSQPWLARLVASQVPIVLSSDAHTPEEVGHHFPSLFQKLRELRAHPWSFSRRQKVALPSQ